MRRRDRITLEKMISEMDIGIQILEEKTYMTNTLF